MNIIYLILSRSLEIPRLASAEKNELELRLEQLNHNLFMLFFSSFTLFLLKLKTVGYKLVTKLSIPVDGEWSQWGSFGVCGANGKKQRIRSCTNPPPLNEGKPCTGSEKEEVSCPGKTDPLFHR